MIKRAPVNLANALFASLLMSSAAEVDQNQRDREKDEDGRHHNANDETRVVLVTDRVCWLPKWITNGAI
jgi:hypothetical protein